LSSEYEKTAKARNHGAASKKGIRELKPSGGGYARS
jgi:hypothetical protein